MLAIEYVYRQEMRRSLYRSSQAVIMFQTKGVSPSILSVDRSEHHIHTINRMIRPNKMITMTNEDTSFETRIINKESAFSFSDHNDCRWNLQRKQRRGQQYCQGLTYYQIGNNSNYDNNISLRRYMSTTATTSLLGKLGIGIGCLALAANLGMVLSAVPALMSKGAPYLPTMNRSIDIVFDDILTRPDILNQRNRTASSTNNSFSAAKNEDTFHNAAMTSSAPEAETPPVVIVDLGSGDGRVCIAAARRGYHAVGYEFNPMLVMISIVWSAFDRFTPTTPSWSTSGSTSFYCRDLWNVNLNNHTTTSDDTNVIVFVYGLFPIMERLSKKLYEEAPKNTIVVSNVFTMDENYWEKIYHREEIFLYKRRRKQKHGGLL